MITNQPNPFYPPISLREKLQLSGCFYALLFVEVFFVFWLRGKVKNKSANKEEKQNGIIVCFSIIQIKNRERADHKEFKENRQKLDRI